MRITVQLRSQRQMDTRTPARDVTLMMMLITRFTPILIGGSDSVNSAEVIVYYITRLRHKRDYQEQSAGNEKGKLNSLISG